MNRKSNGWMETANAREPQLLEIGVRERFRLFLPLEAAGRLADYLIVLIQGNVTDGADEQFKAADLGNLALRSANRVLCTRTQFHCSAAARPALWQERNAQRLGAGVPERQQV